MNSLKCDLLVAGGGIAGMCAAVSAARCGMDVILINDRSVLGGNASSEIGVVMSGACHQGHNPAIYAKESGLVEEIRMSLTKYETMGGYGFYAMLDAVFFDFIYKEKNIRLMLNTLVEGCDVSDGEIKGCRARHCVNNEEFFITAKYYIDATGNGTLCYTAGAEYMIGREGKKDFNEFWAPDEADRYTMGNSLYFEVEDAGREVSFKPPDFAHDITKMDFLKDIDKPENFRGLSVDGPNWTYEFGGQLDILKDHDLTELELRKLIFGIWDYIKNSGKYPAAKTKRLKRVFSKAGMRESRRFIGDHILTENDVENKINFPDSVAIGGWPMDIHAPLGIYDKLPATNFVPVTGTYNIPFRCLYSKDIKNLMMAGRNISATHIALGSTRVMATCGAIGQAVGTAAYLCSKYDVSPRELAKDHIKELQQLLLGADQTILHLKDCVSEGFSAYSDNEAEYENKAHSGFMKVERDYVLMLMPGEGKIDSVDIYMRGNGKQDIKIFTGTHPETFLPEKEEKTVSAEVSGEGWVRIPVESSPAEDGKIYLVFVKNKNIELGISENRPIGAISGRMHSSSSHDGKNHDSTPLSADTGYIAIDHNYEIHRNIMFKDIMPKKDLYGAENIINGYSRPYKTPDIWMPKTLPATVTISAKEPVYAKNISLIFDTSLDTDEKSLASLASLVKSYEMKVYGKNGVKTFVNGNNFYRVSPHEINDEIERIELTIKESHGKNAGVYGIRIN